jgi:hypothetical protein
MLTKEWLETKIEPLARMIAAEKMGLVKDRYGENLPDDLWKGSVKEARKELGLED